MKTCIFHIIWIVTLFSISQTCHCQTLDGYKYLYLPPLTYTDGSVDKWGIADKVLKCFEEKGFVVIQYKYQLPDYRSNESRGVLICSIEHTADSYDLYNHVTITLSNIFNEKILTLNGSGMGLTVQGDLNIATRNALKPIERMSYHFDSKKMPGKYYPEAEKTMWDETSIKHYLDTCSSLSEIEGVYKSVITKHTGYYKIGIIRDGYLFKAIIIESDNEWWEKGEVKGIFEKGNLSLYSTRFYLINRRPIETFATYDSKGVLVIDLDNTIGEKLSFIKLYPEVQSTPPKTSTQKPTDSWKASGTGFFISKDGYIATNAHVISGHHRITVEVLINDKVVQCEAREVISDAVNDIAIIKIEDTNFSPFSSLPYTIENNINIGGEVYTIGFPLNSIMGTNCKVTNGIISASTGIDDDIRYYQITVPIQPGNSGGPLINKNGNIVGITSARLNGNAVGVKVENVNYAVKSPYLLNIINMVPRIDTLPKKSLLIGRSMEEQIAIWKNYICLIKIY